MDKSGAASYTFAKASGNLGKSFIADRAQILFEQKSLGDLWTLLFKSPLPLIPEVLLAEKIEKEAFSKFFSDYTGFVSMFDKPSTILTDQFCIYEAENLKVILAALSNKESEMPSLVDLGSFATCNYQAWPNLEQITSGTQFQWLKKLPSDHEQEKLEFKLDIQVIQHLWKAIQKYSGESKEGLVRLFKAEYVIKNIVWALRLRIYYKMDKDQIIAHLIYVSDAHNQQDPIAGPAIKILDFPLDEAGPWENWRYKDYVNPHIPGEIWKIDPAWIEKVGKSKLNKLALNLFHQYPMSDCSLLGWYKIKEYELSCIRTAVESLRLNINPEDAMRAINLIADGGTNG
ncbi:MAG: V-type ATPase subunit [Treponema sp.]|nr:V-type ATPase subunit [Treponema sp.]